MKEFKVIQVLYFLPVFFFTLAVSPNIVGWRIAYVLGLFYLILIPVTNIIARCFRQGLSEGKLKKILIYTLAVTSIGLSLYLGWKINWQYVLLQIIYVIFILSIYSRQKISGKVLNILGFMLGMLLFSATYIGLNQYGFIQLLSIKNFVEAGLCSLITLRILYSGTRSGDRMYSSVVVRAVIIFDVMAFTLFFFYYFKWEYAALFSIALIPSTILSYTFKSTPDNSLIKINKKMELLRLVYAISLSAFFIYFFLDSTQVLQALKGGY